MLNDGKFTAFLNNLFQGIVSVSDSYFFILTVKTCLLQSTKGEM